MPSRRDTLKALIATFAVGAVPAVAHADTWPAKPIRMIVPFPPGSSPDLIARIVTEKLATVLGQPVVVENRPGAGGNIGTGMVAKAAPDGYTLLFTINGPLVTAPSLYRHLSYDPMKQLAPVTLVATSPNVLVIDARLPVHTLREFVALAKSKPGELSFGSAGNGTSMHLTGEMYKQAADVSMVHVPYRGSAAMLTDLMGGQIQVTFGDVLVLMPQIQAGKVRALAVTSKTRHPLLPDVPTLDEAGLKGFEALSWQGLFAPAGTPPEIVDKLSAEVVKVMQSPDIKDYFAAQGFIVQGSTPEAFKAFVASEVQKWTPIVKNSGAQVN